MKKTGRRTGAAARSGPAIPDNQRGRPRLSLTLSPAALDALSALAAELGESRSSVVEALVVSAAAERQKSAPPRE